MLMGLWHFQNTCLYGEWCLDSATNTTPCCDVLPAFQGACLYGGGLLDSESVCKGWDDCAVLTDCSSGGTSRALAVLPLHGAVREYLNGDLQMQCVTVG